MTIRVFVHALAVFVSLAGVIYCFYSEGFVRWYGVDFFEGIFLYSCLIIMDNASLNVEALSKRAFVVTLFVLWGSEVLQGLGIIRGVFGWGDFVAFFLGALLAFLIDRLVR